MFFTIFIHELGHYFSGILNRLKAREVSAGVGPKLVGIKIKGTSFNLSLLPVAGVTIWDNYDSYVN